MPEFLVESSRTSYIDAFAFFKMGNFKKSEELLVECLAESESDKMFYQGKNWFTAILLMKSIWSKIVDSGKPM